MKEYGLIGKKLGHSYSADFFAEKFKRDNIDATYGLYPLPSESDVKSLISSHPYLAGLNVTIPYKESILRFCNYLSSDVTNIGAANVIKIERDYKDRNSYILKAFNTDWIGFKDSLLRAVKDFCKEVDLSDREILKKDFANSLVLGTGGAAKAIVYALEILGINITLVSRNPDKVSGFKDHKIIGYEAIDEEVMHTHRLVVNTTPCGMFPNVDEAPVLPYDLFGHKHIAYDLIYNPAETLFMKLARDKGAYVINGLDMLYRQAELSWKIWNDPLI